MKNIFFVVLVFSFLIIVPSSKNNKKTKTENNKSLNNNSENEMLEKIKEIIKQVMNDTDNLEHISNLSLKEKESLVEQFIIMEFKYTNLISSIGFYLNNNQEKLSNFFKNTKMSKLNFNGLVKEFNELKTIVDSIIEIAPLRLSLLSYIYKDFDSIEVIKNIEFEIEQKNIMFKNFINKKSFSPEEGLMIALLIISKKIMEVELDYLKIISKSN